MYNSTLCYLEQDGNYLMLLRNRKKNDPNHMKWIGVGGKFEAGESPEECLRREVREETGLTLTGHCLRGIVTFVSDQYPTEYMFLYTSSDFCGEIGPCDEGELQWVPVEQVPQLPLWAGDRVFLRLLAENAPFFSLKLVYQGDALTRAVLNGSEMPTM